MIAGRPLLSLACLVLSAQACTASTSATGFDGGVAPVDAGPAPEPQPGDFVWARSMMAAPVSIAPVERGGVVWAGFANHQRDARADYSASPAFGALSTKGDSTMVGTFDPTAYSQAYDDVARVSGNDLRLVGSVESSGWSFQGTPIPTTGAFVAGRQVSGFSAVDRWVVAIDRGPGAGGRVEVAVNAKGETLVATQIGERLVVGGKSIGTAPCEVNCGSAGLAWLSPTGALITGKVLSNSKGLLIYPRAPVALTDGFAAAIHYFSGLESDDFTEAGDGALFAKWSSSGNLVFSIFARSSGANLGPAVALSNGGIALAASSSTPVDVQGLALGGSAGRGGLLLLSSKGATTRALNLGVVLAMQARPSGGVLLVSYAGCTDGSCPKRTLTALTSEGVTEWTREFTVSSGAAVTDVAQGDDGLVYVAGTGRLLLPRNAGDYAWNGATIESMADTQYGWVFSYMP